MAATYIPTRRKQNGAKSRKNPATKPMNKAFTTGRKHGVIKHALHDTNGVESDVVVNGSGKKKGKRG